MVYGTPQATLEAALAEDAWRRISRAPRRLLMIEYDGVLAPFGEDRERVAPSEDRLAALATLMRSPADRVVVIAGRSLHEIETLLEPCTPDLVGEHGWEEHAHGSDRVIHPLPPTIAHRLGQATRIARASGYEALLERKRCSVVLHTRGLTGWEAEEAEETCRAMWSKPFERDGLRLLPIECGLELRATQRHEGVAIADWIARTAAALPIYIGSLTTGLLAFRRVHGIGINVQVGGLQRSPLADTWLESDDQVTALLDRFATLQQ